MSVLPDLSIQSESINELAGSLSKAQGEMSFAVKGSANPFYKSKYADLSSIWESCRETLAKYNLGIVQSLLPLGEKILLVSTLTHSSGQWIRSYMPLITAKVDAQGYGAAITYMRRYTLSALIGIVTDEDDDGNTASGIKCKPEKKISLHDKKKSIDEVEDFFFSFNGEEEEMREWFTDIQSRSRKPIVEIIEGFNKNRAAGEIAFQEWRNTKVA